MSSDKQVLQDTFLHSVRRAQIPVTVFLVNGVKLQGVFEMFDNFTVMLGRDGQVQLVFKHAISTIMPAQTPNLSEPDAQDLEPKPNLQDTFLNRVRKLKTPVTVFLVNGVKLQGILTWFDNFTVLLRRDGQGQLVYKHAISTIMPNQPISLYDADDSPAEQ